MFTTGWRCFWEQLFFLLQPLSSYDKVLVFVMVSVNRVRVQVCVFVCG